MVRQYRVGKFDAGLDNRRTGQASKGVRAKAKVEAMAGVMLSWAA